MSNENQPAVLGPSLHGCFWWDSSKHISALAKFCFSEVHGDGPGFPTSFLLSRSWSQPSHGHCLKIWGSQCVTPISSLYQEVFINALQETCGYIVLCCIDLPTDIGVVKVPVRTRACICELLPVIWKIKLIEYRNCTRLCYASYWHKIWNNWDLVNLLKNLT